MTLDGRPLYRFAEDSEHGKATGDGATDSFGGQQFTWHAEGSRTPAVELRSGGAAAGSYSY